MVTKAYDLGRRARAYSDNPYEIDSAEYNDFERGHTQKIRAGGTTGSNAYAHFGSQFDSAVEWSDLKRSRPVKDKPAVKVNSYAQAKKK